MTTEREARLALAAAPGFGPRRIHRLLEVFGSVLEAARVPAAELQARSGLPLAACTVVRQLAPDAGTRLLEAATALGAEVFLLGEPGYPDRLTSLPDPPPALYALGNSAWLRAEAVAVVGSRDHTRYGADACRLAVRAAVDAGLVVVSGMARGLDAVAHEAALEAGGGTIGVLGNGLGVVYPAANRRLYERVAREGLLLTEFAPGERPNAGSFPRRNRIVAGLSRATLVVEAAEGSGALITAGFALEQGRDVLAVPGPITSRTSTGTNRLIRDGAAPFLEPADLHPAFPGRPVRTIRPEPADPIARLLLEGPLPVDLLARRAGTPVTELLAALSRLELEGVLARQDDGLIGLTA